MTLEIQVLAWYRHTYVVGLNRFFWNTTVPYMNINY